ncbi:MAG TPA: RNA 2',3'-cyclic phosphodiesterase, partial [Candidatus Limnocylindria bacterium]
MTEPAVAPRPWRCFVAVQLPDTLRQVLRASVAELRHDAALDAAWRWVDPAGWHITLAFLGATAPDAAPGIADGLARDLAGREGFSVATGGMGAFPVRRRARVLWYGIVDPDRRLAELAGVVRASTGTDEAASFRPHITLARARDRHGSPLPPLAEELPTGEFQVDGVVLMRSHLGNGPARYEALSEV